MNKTYQYVGTLFENENNPGKVTVALTMANQALAQGYSAALILMIDAVHLSVPGKIDNIDVGAPFKDAKTLQENFLANGGEILICESCMVHNNIPRETTDQRFGTITAEGVVKLLMNAQGGLQVS